MPTIPEEVARQLQQSALIAPKPAYANRQTSEGVIPLEVAQPASGGQK